MSRAGRHRGSTRRPFVAVTAIVLCLLVVGVYFRIRAQAPDPTSAARVRSTPTVSAPTVSLSTAPRIIGVDADAPSTPAPKVGVPVHLSVPSIGVSTELQALTLLPDGSLQPPSHWSEAGWYRDGVVPGRIGPAVIAGHIDSTRGPAVFYRLREVIPGARISVTDRGGTVLTFAVDQVQAYPKDDFPTEAVYGPTPDAELRLITCTGQFDSAARSYLSNLVVSAHLVPR